MRVAEEALLPTDEAPCFRINDVRLSGNDAGHFSWALKALNGPTGKDSPIGRCLGVKAIEVLQKRLQNEIIARGFITSRVLVTNQNLADGTLVFEPLAGRLEKLVDKSQPASGQVSLAQALPSKPGDLLNLRDVEQALDNLQRVPTVTADLQMVPGQTPGTSDLELSWKQAKPWRLGLSLDDAGSDNTGRYQGSATVSGDNLLGLSDLAYVSASKGFGGSEGPKPKGSQSLALHYSVPSGYWLYRANLGLNRFSQTVEGAFDNYLYSGKSDNLDLGIDRVLMRDNRQILTLQSGLQRRSSRNFIDDTEVLVQRRAVTSLQLSLNHRWYVGRSVLQSDLGYRQGIKGLGSLPAPEEEFGEGTSRYRLTTASVNLQSPFAVGSQQLRYLGSVRLQKNHTTLTPQDRFSIGGRQSVRGYDNKASLTAESGVLLRNEVAWLIKDLPQVAPYLGFDIGRVSGPSVINLPGKGISGAVIGLRGQLGPFQYEVFYGRPVKKPEELKASPSAWGFALHQSY